MPPKGAGPALTPLVFSVLDGLALRRLTLGGSEGTDAAPAEPWALPRPFQREQHRETA